jgi:hypothetical protein
VFNYTKQAEQALLNHSTIVGDEMKYKTADIYSKFLQVNRVNAINVSYQTRSAVEKQLQIWRSTAMLSRAMAQTSLATDKSKRADVFKTAFKEIFDMTYRNMWSKFRVAEAQAMACGNGGDGGSGSPSQSIINTAAVHADSNGGIGMKESVELH